MLSLSETIGAHVPIVVIFGELAEVEHRAAHVAVREEGQQAMGDGYEPVRLSTALPPVGRRTMSRDLPCQVRFRQKLG